MTQQNRRKLNLAALDEHLANEGFVAELERNTSNRVSNDSQEPLHKKGKIMQNTSVNIYSSEAVMFSKQKSRNAENLYRLQYVKPPAKRETQPHLGHVAEPVRAPENNVENIQEEIKSYFSSCSSTAVRATTKWTHNNRASWYPVFPSQVLACSSLTRYHSTVIMSSN